jgi:hypothetical protein
MNFTVLFTAWVIGLIVVTLIGNVKGWPGWAFVTSLLLSPIVGLLVVIALPDRNDRDEQLRQIALQQAYEIAALKGQPTPTPTPTEPEPEPKPKKEWPTGMDWALVATLAAIAVVMSVIVFGSQPQPVIAVPTTEGPELVLPTITPTPGVPVVAGDPAKEKYRFRPTPRPTSYRSPGYTSACETVALGITDPGRVSNSQWLRAVDDCPMAKASYCENLHGTGADFRSCLNRPAR